MDSAMIRILDWYARTELKKEAGVGCSKKKLKGLMAKKAFIGSDNPLNQVISNMFMQAPPPNLGTLAALAAQKYEKDLREDLERPSQADEEAMDPLVAENRRLSRLVDNLRHKKELIEKQKELAQLQGEMAALQGMAPNPAAGAAAGGLPQDAGGVPPEAAAEAQQPIPQGTAQDVAPPDAPPEPMPVNRAPASGPQAPPGEASGFGGTPGAGQAGA